MISMLHVKKSDMAHSCHLRSSVQRQVEAFPALFESTHQYAHNLIRCFFFHPVSESKGDAFEAVGLFTAGMVSRRFKHVGVAQ